MQNGIFNFVTLPSNERPGHCEDFAVGYKSGNDRQNIKLSAPPQKLIESQRKISALEGSFATSDLLLHAYIREQNKDKQANKKSRTSVRLQTPKPVMSIDSRITYVHGLDRFD
jgi:hypothetical protein